nr:MAG TPA: hypothetical protein [Crassvirales sp.]
MHPNKNQNQQLHQNGLHIYPNLDFLFLWKAVRLEEYIYYLVSHNVLYDSKHHLLYYPTSIPAFLLKHSKPKDFLTTFDM